jgi:hypothetical protein
VARSEEVLPTKKVNTRRVAVRSIAWLGLFVFRGPLIPILVTNFLNGVVFNRLTSVERDLNVVEVGEQLPASGLDGDRHLL